MTMRGYCINAKNNEERCTLIMEYLTKTDYNITKEDNEYMMQYGFQLSL